MSGQRSKNRRRAQRYPADIGVRVYFRGRAVDEYQTADVSQGGLCLRPGRVMFWQGTRLEVELFQPHRSVAPRRRLAVLVRYCNHRGMGLKFRSDQLPALAPAGRAERGA